MKIVIDMVGLEEDKDGEILSYVIFPRNNLVVQLLKHGIGFFGNCHFLLKPKRIKKDMRRTFNRLYDLYSEEGEEIDRKEFISRFPGTGEAVVLAL